MRTKDLKVDMKVWYNLHPSKFALGLGEQVTVQALGRYTVAQEPCGPLIVPTTAPGPTGAVIKFAVDDNRNLMLWSKTGKRQFKLLREPGRYLMHEDEHKVLRQAAADRQLEVDAHVARGNALRDLIESIATKNLADAGLPVELLDVEAERRGKWTNGKGYTPDVRVSVNPAKIVPLVNSLELKAALKDWAAWIKKPVPGQDCKL